MRRINKVDAEKDALTEKIVATQWVHRQPQVVVSGKPYAHIAQYARAHQRSQSARTWKQGSTLGGVLPPALRGPVLDLLPPIALWLGRPRTSGRAGAQGAHGTHRHGPLGLGKRPYGSCPCSPTARYV